MRKLIFLSLVISTIYTPSLLAAENAGKTIMSRGDVQAFDARSQKSRPLKRRAPIFSVDKVITKETGRAQFSMSDGGLLSIKPNSEVFISSYAYDPESKQGSAVIELVKGGLRSISGQIKKHGGDYQVKTPVGSIGIRGTHFELAMVNDDMFIAVWDGAIDLMSNDESTVSFGQDEAFSFGKVSMDGTITELLAPPSIFEQGHSTKVSSSNSEETSEPESVDESIVSVSEQQDLENVDSIITNSEVDNSVYSEQQFLVSSETTLADALATRTGSYTYQTLEQAEVTSNLGSVRDFGLSMSVNFDNGVVSDGSLTAVDSGGEWYAAFSGLINVTDIDLAVTFASYGDEKATGSIDGVFTDGGDSITGNFELFEILVPEHKLNGSFKVK